MNPSEHVYNQPEKERTRWLALCHAVECLTTHRQQSPVITLKHFDAAMKYACDLIERTNQQRLTCLPYPHEQVKNAAERFKQLHESRVGRKSAKDLTVLFLAGPNPMNDLRVLTELGVAVQNIWAIESDSEAYKIAIESVSMDGSPLKLYHGSLHQFFAIVPQQFDIVYFDACSPLSGRKSNTLQTLHELFLQQRLTPLSAVITNFSEANFSLVEDDASREQSILWAARIGTWSFMRDEYEDFEKDYFEHVRQHLADYYSDFVTRFVVEFAGLLIPWWRVAILPGAKGEYYANGDAIKAAIRGKQEAGFSIEAMFFQDSFPEFLRLVDVADEKLAKNDPLRQLLFEEKLNGMSLAAAVRLAYFLGYSRNLVGRK